MRVHYNFVPDRVQDAAVFLDAEQLVGRGDCVQVRFFAVVKERIRLPDALQHFNAQAQRLDGPVEAQPLILPLLFHANCRA